MSSAPQVGSKEYCVCHECECEPRCKRCDKPFKPESQDERWNTFISTLEKISLLGLVAFTFYMAPDIAGYAACGGFVIGVYLYWGKQETKKTIKAAACSQQFLSQLTGVELPAPLSIAANVAMTVCHLEHHPYVFAPLIGLNFGLLAGKIFCQIFCPLVGVANTVPKPAIAH